MADIRIAVLVDTEAGTVAIQKLEGAVQGLAKAHDSAGAAGSAFGAMYKNVVAGIVSGQAIINAAREAWQALKDFMIGSIEAAMEAERIEVKLTAALRATGREVDANTRYYMAQAHALESVTIYRHDDIAAAEDMLITLTKLNREGMEQAIHLAIGLAAVYGGDLQTYLRQVAMGFEGQYMQLGRLVPAVREATTAQDKHNAMIKASGEMFQIALAQAETFSGRLEQLKNMFHSFQEKVGLAVTNSSSLNAILQLIKVTLEELANAPDPTKGPMGALMWMVEQTAAHIYAQFGPAMIYLYVKQKEANEAAKEVLGGMIGQTVAYTAAGLAAKKHAEELARLKEATDAYDKSLTALGSKSGETLADELKGARAELDAALARKESAGVVEELAKKVSDLQEKLAGANFELDRYGHLVPKGSQVVEYFKNIEPAVEADVIALGQFKTLLGAVYGGEIGKGLDVSSFTGGIEIAAGATTKTTDNVYKLRDAWLQARSAFAADTTSATKYAALIAAQKAYNDAVEHMPVAFQKMGSALNDFLTAAVPIYQQFEAIQAQLTTNAMQRIDNEYNARLTAIKKNIKDTTAQQAAITALDSEFDIRRKNAAREEAKTGKAVALVGAVVNTAEAITSALKVFPPWLGIALAAVVGAMGAVQVGLIAAQPLPLAKGAVFSKPTIMAGGAYQVGDVPNEPEYVAPESMLKRAFLAAGGGLTVNINSPLVATSGLADSDLTAAGTKLLEVVKGELRRYGRGL